MFRVINQLSYWGGPHCNSIVCFFFTHQISVDISIIKTSKPRYINHLYLSYVSTSQKWWSASSANMTSLAMTSWRHVLSEVPHVRRAARPRRRTAKPGARALWCLVFLSLQRLGERCWRCWRTQMGMGQNLVPLVNPKIAGKWMWITH